MFYIKPTFSNTTHIWRHHYSNYFEKNKWLVKYNLFKWQWVSYARISVFRWLKRNEAVSLIDLWAVSSSLFSSHYILYFLSFFGFYYPGSSVTYLLFKYISKWHLHIKIISWKRNENLPQSNSLLDKLSKWKLNTIA